MLFQKQFLNMICILIFIHAIQSTFKYNLLSLHYPQHYKLLIFKSVLRKNFITKY